MDDQRSSLLNLPYHFQTKGLEELRQSLLCTTLELESTRLAAQEEIKRREEQLTHLKQLLNKALKDRDEALAKCNKLFLEQQQPQPQPQSQLGPRVLNSGATNIIIENELTTKILIHHHDTNHSFTSSDYEESIVSSPESNSPALPEVAFRQISGKKPLPEKGKLLEAVMKAGPLLQTLLLAGPLPQWRHPPPPLGCFEIPPVKIPATFPAINATNNCGMINKKRGYFEGDGDDCSSEGYKYQRVLFH